ncbi:bifunctional ornithine acetyltransferase/N-acetylglutamate synthase [Candidatus Endobugula sertula]|uniref:Arginine biosynthesis bifunctional protein ArgJ n=1 Tax=Candidatus Endobugula sertula TaxID=62101 RepID=A0A1D2QTL0_9GAMM|nr:bifunctional ornithine acetyltransferase/N-acetylglutamate synthase [Candidatus Endobugula sertula]
MAVGILNFPTMPIIDGVQLNAISAGIKNNKCHDLVLIALPDSAKTAGVFTQNAFCAAPVVVCKSHLSYQSRYLIINSGNANACTGEQGLRSAISCCEALAQSTNVNTTQVLPFSTGVIGDPLPVEKITAAIPELLSGLSEDHWQLAAKGMMTTDTRPKGATASFDYCGETFVVNGICKGAGMIKPNMATMLGFVVSNANISQSLLEQLSRDAVNQSFNRITIDGDTSTNDSCMLMTTCTTSQIIDNVNEPLYTLFKDAVTSVYQTLAQAIIRDGEGATKFVTLQIEEGANANECLQVAYAIAHSPLVKTALFASDPNWGRIAAAIGYAGIQQLNVDLIRVYLNDTLIIENGGRSASYTEAAGQAAMDQAEILLRVCLGRGDQQEVLWTTDLSHEYVTINAEYRN